MNDRLCRDPNHLLEPHIPPAVLSIARGERLNPARRFFAWRWLLKQIARW